MQIRTVGQPAKADKPKQGASLLLGIFRVNIADETTDVIVNTTTEDMNLSISAVSKAILKIAGPKLQMMCKQLVDSGMKLEHGQTVVMNATGGLRCKKIIQAYVPLRHVATSSQIDHFQLIQGIVTDCLKKVDAEGLKSITFPAFGFGQGGYMVHEVADPILTAIKEFSQTNPTSLKTIRIAIFDEDHHQKFYNYFCKFFDYDPSLASPISPGVFQTLKGYLDLGSSRDDCIMLNETAPGRAQLSSPSPLWAISRAVGSSNPVAVFQIYAASDQKCNEIEKLLRDDIKQRVVTRKLENFLIGDYMIEDDMEDIQKFEDQFGVEVKIMMQEKEIQISGEAAKVFDATLKIKDLVIEIEKAILELRLYEWQWMNDDGTIEAYQYEASVKLERAFRKDLEVIEMIIENVSVLVDLKYMEEIDRSTGKRRDIKRIKKPYTIGKLIHSYNIIINSLMLLCFLEYPSTWEAEPLKYGKPITVHMFPITAGTPEYQAAIKEFQDTIGAAHTIVEVKRIQNRSEYSRYIALRDAIQRKNSKPVGTRRLFHGSKLESLELIAVRGFNRNFAADTNGITSHKNLFPLIVSLIKL
jgi:O-acetyl-ADP-ribose deacetylase (regulator of RNase III)